MSIACSLLNILHYIPAGRVHVFEIFLIQITVFEFTGEFYSAITKHEVCRLFTKSSFKLHSNLFCYIAHEYFLYVFCE